MKIFVFGNPDLQIDSLPLRILDQLKKELQDFDFLVKDPNEEWDVPEKLIVLDTVVGIEKVQIFNNLDVFASTPRLTMHGFDALMNLRLLHKLGKIKKIKIIGIPPTISETEAIQDVVANLRPN